MPITLAAVCILINIYVTQIILNVDSNVDTDSVDFDDNSSSSQGKTVEKTS